MALGRSAWQDSSSTMWRNQPVQSFQESFTLPCLTQLNHRFSYLLLLGPEISEASKSLNSHRSWKRKQPLKLPLKGYRGLTGQTWPREMHRRVREMQAPHPTLAEEGKPSQPDPIYPQRRSTESPSNAAGLFLSRSDPSLVTA